MQLLDQLHHSRGPDSSSCLNIRMRRKGKIKFYYPSRFDNCSA